MMFVIGWICVSRGVDRMSCLLGNVASFISRVLTCRDLDVTCNVFGTRINVEYQRAEAWVSLAMSLTCGLTTLA